MSSKIVRALAANKKIFFIPPESGLGFYQWEVGFMTGRPPQTQPLSGASQIRFRLYPATPSPPPNQHVSTIWSPWWLSVRTGNIIGLDCSNDMRRNSRYRASDLNYPRNHFGQFLGAKLTPRVQSHWTTSAGSPAKNTAFSYGDITLGRLFHAVDLS